MKRITALILLSTMILGILAGCANATDDSTPPVETTPPSVSATASAATVPTTAPAEISAEDAAAQTDQLLQSALDDRTLIITPEGWSVFLSEYLPSQSVTMITAYTLVDFDQDGQKEMVLQTDSEFAAYILLHCAGTDVFAFPFGARSLCALKADGSFAGSSGAFYTDIFTLRFNGGGYILNHIAHGDDLEGIYELNGKPVSHQEFSAFADEWYALEAAGWNALTTVPAETLPPETAPPTQPMQEVPYVQNIGLADQSIYGGPGYDYGYVRTVEKAGIYTIVEEQYDPEGNLWGKLKSGAGWVNLTQIRATNANPPLITANYADDTLLSSGNFHHCVADTSEYMVQIAFRANEVLMDVAFFDFIFTDDMEVGSTLYTIGELTPDRPFVADVSFPGDMSQYGISFTDSQGVAHYYCVYTSGRDGSLVLSPFTP